jgi:spermidine/putrescine transport system substrate-binding protein
MWRRTFLIASVAGVTACGHRPRLNVYNYSEYIAPDTIPNFEREFGVRVRYGTYESNEEMLAQVLSGNSGWDVVFPSEAMIRPMRQMSLLAGIQRESLPNLAALAPDFQTPAWDPQFEWCVPYMHGATGILYQKSVAKAPARWADLWDPSLRGRLTMLDDATEVFAACLKRLGYSVNSPEENQLRDAKALAVQQKPWLRAYLNAEVRDQVVAGDVLAAQTWTVTAGQAIAAAPTKLAFAYPAEGFPRYADNVAILRESRRIDLAHQWLNYLLRPEVAAANSTAARTATVNREGQRLLPPELLNDPVLYPPADVLSRGEWFQAAPSTAAQRLRDRLWTEIKSA